MNHRQPRAFGAAALCVLLAGCAGLQGPPPEPYATVIIENDSPMNVNIHAQRNGARVRVGMVPGVTTREFPLRGDMLGPAGDLRLTIDPIGSPRTYAAMPINVNRGDTIQLRVGAIIR